MLGMGVGYTPPLPAGEGATVLSSISRVWMIPIITTLGSLISGLIVYKLAPEAEDHVTDAAIDSFHNKGGFIRRRVPFIKVVASAITIGSGGSAGREGLAMWTELAPHSAFYLIIRLRENDARVRSTAVVSTNTPKSSDRLPNCPVTSKARRASTT